VTSRKTADEPNDDLLFAASSLLASVFSGLLVAFGIHLLTLSAGGGTDTSTSFLVGLGVVCTVAGLGLWARNLWSPSGSMVPRKTWIREAGVAAVVFAAALVLFLGSF
jgi:hypothetical protein